MSLNILVVEDEVGLAEMLQRGLRQDGATVSVAMSGTMGLQMAMAFHFDAIILDIMLPEMNGLEVCKKLREQQINTPVLMLTALDSPENIVTGLDCGADDYMVKPFNFSELGARIRTITRRSQPATASQNIIRIADLEVDLLQKNASRGGNRIVLTATEFRLLEFLARHQRKVFSRFEILENVWNIDFNLSTNVVDVYINYLRKKLDRDYEPKLIHTIIGLGYVLKDDSK